MLKNLINVIKGMKQSTGASQEVDQPEIEAFVFNKFKEVDNELRSGNANAVTIKRLLDAASLIDLLMVFGPLGTESAKRSRA